jgi:hypothetical protein
MGSCALVESAHHDVCQFLGWCCLVGCFCQFFAFFCCDIDHPIARVTSGGCPKKILEVEKRCRKCFGKSLGEIWDIVVVTCCKFIPAYQSEFFDTGVDRGGFV